MVVTILHQHILCRIILNLYIDLNMNFLQNLLIPRLLDIERHQFQQNISLRDYHQILLVDIFSSRCSISCLKS